MPSSSALRVADFGGKCRNDVEEIADRYDVTEALGEQVLAQDLAAADGFVWITTGEGGLRGAQVPT